MFSLPLFLHKKRAIKTQYLFSKQYINNSLNRYDILVRYLTIEYFEIFKKLISDIQLKGFDYNYPIIVDKQLHIIDGSHRMACALYFHIEEITIKIKKTCSPHPFYAKQWFIKKNIINKENNLLIEKITKKISDKRKIFLSLHQ